MNTLIKNKLQNRYMNDFLMNAPFFGTLDHNERNVVTPAANIREMEKSFMIEIAAPGLNKSDFKVDLNENILAISAQVENKSEEKPDNGKYTRREFSFNSFKRSFTLPEGKVDVNEITAQYENGVLTVSIPKSEPAAAARKQIEVK